MNDKIRIGDTVTKSELISLYGNITHDAFSKAKDFKKFKLIVVKKEKLYYAKPHGCSSGRNLNTFYDWLNMDDNCDFHHTDTVYDMVKSLNAGEDLLPLVVDTEYGLYDGAYRLTALSMIDSIEEILVFKEL